MKKYKWTLRHILYVLLLIVIAVVFYLMFLDISKSVVQNKAFNFSDFLAFVLPLFGVVICFVVIIQLVFFILIGSTRSQSIYTELLDGSDIDYLAVYKSNRVEHYIKFLFTKLKILFPVLKDGEEVLEKIYCMIEIIEDGVKVNFMDNEYLQGYHCYLNSEFNYIIPFSSIKSVEIDKKRILLFKNNILILNMKNGCKTIFLLSGPVTDDFQILFNKINLRQ